MENTGEVTSIRKSRKTQAWLDEHGNKGNDIIRIEGVDRLVTRNLLRSTEQVDKNDDLSFGTLIWGYCRGWWPALVIAPEDLKNNGNPKKLWVFWLIDSKVSQLIKTSQVIMFCDGDQERLITIIRKMKVFDNPFIKIMEILANRMECIFSRPYEEWIEKYFSTLINHREYLIFYPYPSQVAESLETFRKVNQQINLQSAKAPPPVKRKNSTKKIHQSLEKSSERINSNHLNVKSQKIGAITWAKIPGQIWWPAMIIDYRDCAMNEPKAESQWVMWYGDYTLSQVNYKYFMEFRVGIKKFEDHIRQSKRETYKRGILEASKDYCTFSGCQTDNWDINDIFNWFQVDNPSSNYLDNENNKYSPKIRMELLKHVSRTSEAAVREHKLQNTEILRVISSHHSDTEKSICLMCLERNQRTMHEHPFFIGLLCDNCMISYRSTIFAYDDDGKCFFCALCTVTDTVVICDNPDCPRVYCTVCMKYLIAPDSYREVLKKKEWNCFLCSESSHVLSNSLVNPRDDWKMRIQKMFSINRHSISHYMQYYEQKKKIRVLSLFDGISSGFLGLQRLGIDIDAYFASEIDTDAELVSKVHFGTTIIRLGDVRNITREILNNLLPIDLLIGGSPCNDLSLVNPKRRGIHDPNGTGILFFEYCRIKNDIEEANEGRNLFWLFENVASMPEEYKKEIDKNLRCEPDLIDSAEFSPQHRPRYYWTNIPMASYTPLVKDLQDVLTPNCNRHALVKKIRTVTTQLKSLKQGSRALKPIIMGEEYDCLWTTELEEIFGFPRHYTDIKNLSATKRQKLIGQAWCVRTITEILRPLKHYFSLNKICN